ncbi:MAG TPA: hypothetical protein VFZ31_16805 [Vicinamibacterales bacterium]
MSAPIDWHSPLRCPHCKAEAGRPFSVQSKSASEITVVVRCSACAYEWKLERESPALAPKFDPRPPGEEKFPK